LLALVTVAFCRPGEIGAMGEMLAKCGATPIGAINEVAPRTLKKCHFILFSKDLMGEPCHVMSEWWCKHFFGTPACLEECLSPFEAILSLDFPLKNKLKP
jgi:hypothetical protein